MRLGEVRLESGSGATREGPGAGGGSSGGRGCEAACAQWQRREQGFEVQSLVGGEISSQSVGSALNPAQIRGGGEGVGEAGGRGGSRGLDGRWLEGWGLLPARRAVSLTPLPRSQVLKEGA